jgi:peptide/nickel transport system substrate-binding protein
MSEKDDPKIPKHPQALTRREFLRFSGLFGLAVGAAPILSACSQESATPEALVPTDTTVPTPSGPKILKIRGSNIPSVDPAYMVGGETLIIDIVFSGLVIQKPNSYEWTPDLAESIEQSEDGKEISFKLREGVQWQKGYGEVTTEDVKFSFERIADPAKESPYATDWLTLDHVEIIDKYNGKIILTEPFAPLWTSTLPVNSGRIVCKKHIEEVGDASLTPVGSGPYIFDELIPDQKVILKRNPDYYGEQPYFDEIHHFIIEDNQAAEVALEAGEIDYTSISLASIKQFESNPNFIVDKRPGLFYSWVGLNVENPKLQDINVRQAIRYGIDPNQILAAAYFGEAERGNAMIPPGLIGDWTDAPQYERDVEKAKEYLAKAGLESLDLEIISGQTAESKIWAEVIQQNLAEVGINVTINQLDASSAWQAGFGDNGKNLELFSMTFSMYPDPSWATMWFTCDQVGVWNWQRYCNEEFDQLHLAAVMELDPQKRNDMYIRMQEIIDEAVDMIWITHGVDVVAYKPNIIPARVPHGQAQLWNFKAKE